MRARHSTICLQILTFPVRQKDNPLKLDITYVLFELPYFCDQKSIIQNILQGIKPI